MFEFYHNILIIRRGAIGEMVMWVLAGMGVEGTKGSNSENLAY